MNHEFAGVGLQMLCDKCGQKIKWDNKKRWGQFMYKKADKYYHECCKPEGAIKVR